MKQKIYSVPLPVILFLNNVSPSKIQKCNEYEVSAFESAEWIVNHFSDFRDSYNSAIAEAYEEYLDYDQSNYRDYSVPEDERHSGLAYGQPSSDEDVQQADSYEPEYLEAEYVESIADISITSVDEDGNEVEEDGYFLIFNDNLGYVTVGHDFSLYGLEVNKESIFMELSAPYSFDNYCGYAASGRYVLSELDLCSKKVYQGQDQAGCGRIYSPELYINDKYGPGFVRKKEKHFLPKDVYTQWFLSAYLQYNESNGQWVGENNCWIVSAYTILQYLVDKNYLNGLDSKCWDSYDFINQEPIIYSQYFDSNDNCLIEIMVDGKPQAKYIHSKESSGGSIFFPEYYMKFRQFANDNYGKCEWGTLSETCKMAKSIAEADGNTFSYQIHSDWKGYLNSGIEQLKRGKPLLWRTSSCTYKNHQMGVFGYEIYEKNQEVNTEDGIVLNINSTKTLFHVFDGWDEFKDANNKKSYNTFFYDMTAHSCSDCSIVSFDY